MWVPEKVRKIVEQMREDIQAALENDPAARSAWEVALLYPGVHAVWIHRVAHHFWRRGHRFLGRLISEIGRRLTGVEIHPGARLGRRLFIDHGMGVVIGETAEVGDDVLMYQGVVLGGTSRERKKRHPTVGDGVVIGAGAILLGPIEVGDHARVGAGSVVVKPVPAGATVVGVPARIARLGNGARPETALEHGRISDPILGALEDLVKGYAYLEQRVERLERALEVHIGRPDGRLAAREDPRSGDGRSLKKEHA
jgi:serine O-acetyltransferase